MKTLTILMFMLVLTPCIALSNSIEDDQIQLKKLQTVIKQLEIELKTSKGKKQDLQNQLRLLDITIGKSNAYIKEIGRQITSYQHKLPKLRREKQNLEINLAKQQLDLARQIRNAYIMGRQNYLKMLLNQQQPATLTRTLVYYDYLNQAKTQQIDKFALKVAQINAVSQNISQQSGALETNLALQIQEKGTLERNYKDRQKLISRLNAQIINKTRKRNIVNQDIENLIRLLDTLDQQKQQPLPSSIPLNFISLKGKMHWPVKGKLLKRYGTTRQLGSLKWQGIVIAASKGKNVRAISDGVVVYADWLRGFGLLMIIDHGDGYMSLYGQNDSLLKNEGTTVGRNEIIANTGRSGGIDQNGLYFEIRHQGKPTNPLNWLSKGK